MNILDGKVRLAAVKTSSISLTIIFLSWHSKYHLMSLCLWGGGCEKLTLQTDGWKTTWLVLTTVTHTEPPPHPVPCAERLDGQRTSGRCPPVFNIQNRPLAAHLLLFLLFVCFGGESVFERSAFCTGGKTRHQLSPSQLQSILAVRLCVCVCVWGCWRWCTGTCQSATSLSVNRMNGILMVHQRPGRPTDNEAAASLLASDDCVQ